MNIALIGYGKMGKAIEEIALSRGHDIVLKIDVDNAHEFSKENIHKADVAIEFTGPHSAFDNVMKCIDHGIPLVCGSTGWTDKLPQATELIKKQNGTFIYASNYSVGVNIFFELNKKLAELMAAQPSYDVQLKEIHHTQKKDAPSGTAITLAEQVMDKITSKKKWVNGESDEKSELVILSERIDPAPGTHEVRYSSSIDDIGIRHTAHTRMGFALGAVLAAEFIKDKKGLFTMKEVLNL